MTEQVKLLPARQVRELLHISKDTMLRWQRDESLGFPPARYVRRRKFYRADEIAAFLNSLPTRRDPAGGA